MANLAHSRSALITGATGFVGSHLARRLISEGWRVSAVVRPMSSTTLLKERVPGVATLAHDGTTGGMIELLREARPDVVFHLASMYVAEHSMADVEPMIHSNILFASQLLEAMVANRNRLLINTGSSWQYDNSGYAPANLYAATKQAFEDILAYYVAAHDLRATSLILFDTYGPDDPRHKLFTLLRRALQTGEMLSLSPGHQLVDLVYIDDVIDAYLHSADLVATQESAYLCYGVSSGRPRSIREIVALVEAILATKLPVEWGGRPYRSCEVMAPWANSRPLPGWAPRTTLDKGITRVMSLEGDRY